MKFGDIEKEAKKLKNDIARISFYRDKLKEAKGDIRVNIREELVSLIRKNGLIKLGIGEPLEYHIGYDSFGQGLEPIYFWVLDFLKGTPPSGLAFEVNKIDEAFDSTVTSSFFGEMGQRTSVMQDRAMKMLELVNTLIRSIINLIYDLKEFEMRMENYKILANKDANFDQKHAAELGLRAIWLDQVDMKRGRGAINNMAQQLQFVTLRDAFFYVKDESLKGYDGNPVDLNERVKRILKYRIQEYLAWKRASEVELNKRYDIEKHYLKTQVDSLRLYTQWAKPYLKAAQKLKMTEMPTKDKLPDPNLVAAFNNMVMRLSLLAKKKISPESINSAFAKTKLKEDYYSCIEVSFEYRTLPRIVAQGQYVQTGMIDVYFKGYVFSGEDLKDLESYEALKDLELVNNLTNVSLVALQDDLDRYLSEESEEKKEEKKKRFEWPLGNLFEGFEKSFGEPVKEAGKGFWKTIRPPGLTGNVDYTVSEVRKFAKIKTIGSMYILYDVFKKAHRMTTW